MPFIRPPHPDPSLDVFDEGMFVLRRDGEVAGHVATIRSTFWSPSSPFRRQWWIWLVAVWPGGTKDYSVEDYAPWSVVTELKDGRVEWESGEIYDAEPLPPDEARRMRDVPGIVPEDF